MNENVIIPIRIIKLARAISELLVALKWTGSHKSKTMLA